MGGEASEFKRLFPPKHIPIILRSILQAGDSLRKKTERDKEDWLTRRLCARLIRIPVFRDGPLNIHPQQEILSSDPDADACAGRIDILVSCGLGHEVYFALEAKRMRVRSAAGRLFTGNHEYVKDGMMRFVAGQYAPFMRAGGMLGYVYDGKTDKARAGVDRAVRGKAKELELAHPRRLAQSRILLDAAVAETTHELKNRPFTIHHIFLSVNPARPEPKKKKE